MKRKYKERRSLMSEWIEQLCSILAQHLGNLCITEQFKLLRIPMFRAGSRLSALIRDVYQGHRVKALPKDPFKMLHGRKSVILWDDFNIKWVDAGGDFICCSLQVIFEKKPCRHGNCWCKSLGEVWNNMAQQKVYLWLDCVHRLEGVFRRAYERELQEGLQSAKVPSSIRNQNLSRTMLAKLELEPDRLKALVGL